MTDHIAVEQQGFYDLLYWQASELARVRRYPEAEAVLAAFATGPQVEQSRSYDLLGRIRVRQRRWAEAVELFRKAIDADPANESAREALDALPPYRRRQSWLLAAAACVAGLIIVIGLVAASTLITRPSEPPQNHKAKKTPASPPSIRPPGPDSKPTPPQEEPLLLLAKTNNSCLGNGQGRLALENFSVPGCTIRTNEDDITIHFDPGLFAYRCEFAQNAEPKVASLAKILATQATYTWLIVEGHTDPEPMPANSLYKDNYELGFHRALAVAQVLREKGRIPASRILIASAGDNESHSTDGADNKPNRRTAVIRIARRSSRTEERSNSK